MEDRIILMGNFIFCPLHQMPLLGNDCHECEFIVKTGEDYFCICKTVDESQTPLGEFDIKELINLLVDFLYSGQTSINKEQLIRLLELESEA